ncbi:hypothetical protein T439DRAFT_381112 [Meredithblackwellia eburnea MCA 4105]
MSGVDPLVPPLRFGLLTASISPDDKPTSLYRGALPKPYNLPFLSTLQLKTVVSVTPKSMEVYEADIKSKLEEKEKEESQSTSVVGKRKRRKSEEVDFTQWSVASGVKVVHVKVGSGKAKDGHIPFDISTVKKVLELMIDRDNLPMYIHDLDGSDVLSMMAAALRKLQGWPEQVYSAEMSRYLRAPPPASEHITFLSRLFAPVPHSSDDGSLFIQVPPPSRRAPWLWPSGMPTGPAPPQKKGNAGASSSSNGAQGSPVPEREFASHPFMRCKVARDPIIAPTSGEELASSVSMAATVSSNTAGTGDVHIGRGELARKDSDGQKTLRGESVGSNTTRTSGTATPKFLEASSRSSSFSQGKGVSYADAVLEDPASARGSGASTPIAVEEPTGDAEDEDEEDEEDDDDEDQVVPVSQMIDALDLGL